MELMAASLDQVAASLSLKQLKFEEGVLGKIAHSVSGVLALQIANFEPDPGRPVVSLEKTSCHA